MTLTMALRTRGVRVLVPDRLCLEEGIGSSQDSQIGERMRTPTIAVPGEVLWYWDAVIYEVPVWAFCEAGTLGYCHCRNEPMTLGSHSSHNVANEVRSPNERCDVQANGKSHQRSTAI